MLARLRELCAEFPFQQKIIVVPSLAIGHQIGDALARSGTAWINLRFETTRTVADAVVGLELAREGVSVLSRAQALALVERACDSALDEKSYFAALRGSPGLHRAIQRSIDDLRLAGIGGSLSSSSFEDPRKARDLERIAAAYDEELARRRLIDRAGVVARAIARLEAGGPFPWGDAVWLASSDVELPHEESRLIALASRGAAVVRIAGVRDDAAAMPKLDSLEIVSASGEENEVRAAFRSILEGGGRHDDAELIYTTADPYLPLVFELCGEYGVDATFAEGVAVSFTSPGEACLSFLRWCGEGWNAADLELAARSGALASGDDLAPATLARVLRAASIGWGAERHRTRLEALVSIRQRAMDDASLSEEQREARARDAGQAQAALEWMKRLLSIVEPLATSPTALALAAQQFVAGFARVQNDRDAMALAALERMFGELAQLPDETIGLPESAARLRDAVLALYVGASNPRPGHLHVAPIRAAAWSGRGRFFLVGLGESRFPGAGLQDPIVLDAERSSLNQEITPRQLALLGDAPLRASERLRRCLARAPQAQWTVSFSSLSLREQREAFPAGDLLEIYRAARGKESATLDEMLAEARHARFIDAGAPLGATEWWLAQRFATQREGFGAEVQRQYPGLARGAAADEGRASTALTRWDGVIPVDPAAIDPRLTGRILSASQVEKMAGCPYGWFLRHVLRIAPPEELLRDPERWLDPRALGVMLHEIFETTMRQLCEEQVTPSLEDHLPMMRGIAEAAMLHWRDEVPPPNEPAFLRQREEVLDTCATFLRVEEKACSDARAIYFELPFGFPDAGAHPAGMTEPLVIELGAGRSVSLRGRIDRVDRTADGKWRVWDYKTGSRYGWDGGWKFSRGRKVQHAIYARALSAALRARGIDDDPVTERSGYLFPTAKGGGEPIAKVTETGELEGVLNRTFDVIAAGFFAHPEDASECRFCDFAEVCGGADAAAERARTKYAANETSPLVERLRRLQDVV